MDFEKIELAGGRAVLYRGDSLALLKAGLLDEAHLGERRYVELKK